MANVQVAMEYVLKLEDATLSGVISEIPGDAGGKTRYGLASRWHPELAGVGFYGPMDKGSALILAGKTLTEQYADPMQVAAINDQTLANVFLAYGVNENPVEAIKSMQDACNRVYPQSQGISIDGVMGPATMQAINRVMPLTLVNAFRLAMVKHYAAHAADNTLRGLIRRALA